jgi:hypothetical protein
VTAKLCVLATRLPFTRMTDRFARRAMFGGRAMEHQGSADELLANLSLAPGDMALLDGPAGPGRLGFAVQLAFWRRHSRFRDDDPDVAPVVIAHLASQVGIVSEALEEYDWVGRTGRRHRRVVLDHLAIAMFDDGAESRGVT